VPGRSDFIKPPSFGIVFLAVPDHVVDEVAASISSLKPSRRLSFVHVSGALRLDALSALSGNPVGSFHPLQSFPAPRDPSAFRGITVAVDASSPALRRRLAKLARDVGARPRHVDDSERVLYHAAAVFASNFVVALVDESASLLEAIGWSRGEALRGLAPLMENALAAALDEGPTVALTGPIRRGDVETVARHLQALAVLDSRSPASPRRVDLYRMLGAIALEIATRGGLDPTAAGRIDRALTRQVAATRRRRQR
jgi:predicted short-subunit dehydrogenase-like oxidoreductase (DUF2520 family)